MDDAPATGPADAVRARAEAALAGTLDLPSDVRGRARVLDPVPVVGPTGRTERWFVPVAVDEALLGFLVLGADLVVHRWSSFARRSGSLDGCPTVDEWLDPERITATASASAGAARPSGPPALSYDGSPDRLAWRVPLDDGRTAWVAGAATWVSSPA